jgi:hypothetical protein
MKKRWMVLTALPLVAATAVAAGMQDRNPRIGGLKRVVDDGHESFDSGAWKKKLAASDLAQREKAFEELADMARRDPEVKKAVDAWANDGGDSELAWTSRLLRREIDRRGGSGSWSAFHRGPQAWTIDPRSGAFDWDDFSRRFEDLDSRFGDLSQEWGEMLRNLPSTSGSSNSSARSLTLQSGPDGVTCKVKENVDGKEQEHTYEAKSMEELLDAHPELRENLGGGAFHVFDGGHGGVLIAPHGGGRGLGVLPRPGGQPGGQAGGPNELRLRAGTDPDGSPRTDRLGIACTGVSEDRASELGLESGVGLEVQEVVPGSIASLLGLHEGDVVAEVNGTAIHSPEDVRKVLADRKGDAEVAVVVLGDDGHKRTLTWKPANSDKKSSEKGDKASGSKKSSRDL